MSSETESVPTLNTFEKCTVVLLDVLGTTTSINFAKETLFPYVIKHAEEFLKLQWDDETVKTAVKELNDKELDLESAVKAVTELTEKGSENKGLKTLQGLIYSKGYKDGELKAHVFSDVPSCLEAWSQSRKVAIYSTGSVESQKQLFSNTVEGDVSSHISKYFDQSVGLKTESDSYKKIVEDLAVKPEEILFVTDSVEEGKAAKSANISVALVTREGNASLPEDLKDFTVIASFKEINFEKTSKRKNTEKVTPTEEPPSKIARTEIDDKQSDKDSEKEIIENEQMEVDAPVEVTPAPQTDGEKSEIKVSEPESIKEKTESKEKTDEDTEKSSQKETPMETNNTTEENTAVEVAADAKSDEPKKQENMTEENKKVDTEKQEDKNIKETTAEIIKEKIDTPKENKIAEEKQDIAESMKEEPVKATNEETEVNTTEVGQASSKVDKTNDVAEKKSENDTSNLTKETEVSEANKVEPSGTDKDKEEKQNTTDNNEKKDKTETTVENGQSETDVAKDEEKNKKTGTIESSVTGDATKDKEVADEIKTEEKVKEANGQENGIKEEKENQKDLANGLENGSSDEKVTNGDAESSQETKKADENTDEIKVKKVETSVDATAVSVEV